MTRTAHAVGATRLDVLASVLLVIAAAAAMVPMLAGGAVRGGIHVSANNLRRISQACAGYEADWNGRQWSKLTDKMMTATGCEAYTSVECPPQMIAGADASNTVWGFWLPTVLQSVCRAGGTCSNWSVMMPIPVGGSTSGSGGSGVASWELVNFRGIREYATGRFYDPLFYAPNDAVIYQQASQYFDRAEEYPSGGTFFASSYCLSPAAMWGIGVLRAPSQGGFRAPDDFPGAYITPTAAMATHPALKTRLLERRWCQNPPGVTIPTTGPTGAPTSTPFHFNAGPASRPGTVFFDGHVTFVPMVDFAEADAQALLQSGDGLWSRDTPFGERGIWSSSAIGSFWNSAHVLTTGGITGRDLLRAQ
jgi:hypothetical protein